MSSYSTPSVCDFSGRWNPVDMVLSPPAISSTESEMRTWPRLALGILKLDPKTLCTFDNCEVMNIEHSETTLTVQHAHTNAPTNAAAAALTLKLDNRPHSFNTGIGPPPLKINSTDLHITACQLDEHDSFDLLIKIEFPARDKKGNVVRKFSSFADEQVALHRAGYILERSHKFSDKTMTQLVQYHRAPASMKDSVVAGLTSEELPIVYAITRTYRRVECKEDEDGEEELYLKKKADSGTGNLVLRSSVVASPVRPTSIVSIVPASPLIRPSSRMSPQVSASPTFSVSSFPSTPSTLPPPLPSTSPPLMVQARPSAPLPFCTLTGTWKLDRTRSDSLEEMMKVLGVPWLARKVVLKLDVTTRIEHSPAEHTCVVTDSSSAGEQVTAHSTLGKWTEVTSKEGKVIRMCAKEGEEMKEVWKDLPRIPSDTPSPFEVSSEPFTFPSYLPIPFSPSKKLHPFTYGYLWIHSFLPDLPGGEMQDIRVLLDRNVMLQCTQVLKDKEVVSTTTRYFNKQETDDERRLGEKEWDEKMDEWRSVQPPMAPGVMLDPDEDGPTMPYDNTNGGEVPNSAPIGPTPNLTGTWSVIKERSNDLSVLLKRMGVPWIYRTFASTVDIKTRITHTLDELVLKDSSKFGTHVQVLKNDGKWAPVVQYGKARRGFCKLKTDEEKKSVTIETVYLTQVKTNKSKVQQQQQQPPIAQTKTNQTPTPTSSKQSASSSSQVSGASSPISSPASSIDVEGPKLLVLSGPSSSPLPSVPAAPSDELTLLTGASHSPSTTSRVVRECDNIMSDSLVQEELDEQVLPPPAMTGEGEEEDEEEKKAEIIPGAADATVAAGLTFDSSSSLTVDSSSPDPTLLDRSPGHTPMEGYVSTSSASTKSTEQNMSASGYGSNSEVMTPQLNPQATPTPTPTPGPAPAASPATSHVVSSRVMDIRVLVDADTMRQVITYLEFDTVVCVCARVFRRELTKAEKAAKAKSDQESKDEEKKKKKKKSDDAGEGEGDNSSSGGQVGLGSIYFPPSSGGPAPGANSARHASHAAPVSVVLPSVAVESAAVAQSMPELPINLSSLTPARAAALFMLCAALASSNLTLITLVACACAGYAYYEYTGTDGLPKGAILARDAAASKSKLVMPSIPIGPGLAVEVVPLRQ